MTRTFVDTKYGISLTDSQWRVVLEEMENEPDSDSISQGLTTFDSVLDDVIANLDSLEADYDWWDNTTGSTVATALERFN